jgi:hypothetical protein
MTAQTARISPTNLPKAVSCKKFKKPEGSRLRHTISPPFPSKLHDLLEDVEKEGPKRDIVSWLPDGKAFKVHKPIDFCKTIKKNYFEQSQYKSFTRQVSLAGGPKRLLRMTFLRSIMYISLTPWFLLLQLYLYGFSKIPTPGTEAGAFMHLDFVRGNKQQSCITIKRNQVTRDRRWNKDSNQYLPAGQPCLRENIKHPESMFRIRRTFDDAVPNKEEKKVPTSMFDQTFFFCAGDPDETAVLSHDSDENNPSDLMSSDTWLVPSMKDDSHHPILKPSFFEWANRRSLDDMHFFDLLEPRPIEEMIGS